MHLDADDEARVAQQRILQLAEADELCLARIFRTGARLAVAFVQHHLLAVVRPAFDICIGAEQLADLGVHLRQPRNCT